MSTHYHVYANDGAGGPVDYSTIVATVSGLTWSSSALGLGSNTIFAVRAFDTGTSAEEKNVDARVQILVSAGGVDQTNLPLPPTLVTTRPLAGGAVRVAWGYPIAAARTKRKPTGFHVYAWTGGTPDYSTIRLTVPYAAVATFRGVIAAGVLTAGSPSSVVVRAYNSVGEEANTNVSAITPDSTAPGQVVGLTAVATATVG